MALREEARKNHEASGSTEPLPPSVTSTPPPRPEPYEEEQMTDVSIDMAANGFDASESFSRDRSIADDVVPNADPGIDRPTVSFQITFTASSDKADNQPSSPVSLTAQAQQGSSPSPTAPHMRRKSVLPLDPAVMRDLQVSLFLISQ